MVSQEEFEKTWTESLPAVRRVISSLSSKLVTQDDMMSEASLQTFLRWKRHGDTMDRITTGWIAQAVRWTCLNEIIKARRRLEIEYSVDQHIGDDAATSLDSFIEADTPFAKGQRTETPEELVSSKRTYLRLKKHIDNLPADFRCVAKACLLYGMSYEETADSLNIPKGTVMSRLSRGRRRLAESIAQDSELLDSSIAGQLLDSYLAKKGIDLDSV